MTSCTPSVRTLLTPAAIARLKALLNAAVNLSPLASPRQFQTTTLLNNGKVLVVGGMNNTGALSSVELYDPTTDTWTTKSSIQNARFFHTATLLPNGNVLVAGGSGTGGTTLSSSEVYDPVTDTWSTTNSLTNERTGHTATLLDSGKVIAIGGDNTGGYLTSVETYDPTTGTWSSAAPLATAHKLHTANLLADGTVLIAGGMNSSGPLSTIEIYDPNANTWATKTPIVNARHSHTSTLLPSGNVLVAGGVDTTYTSTASVELYNPSNDTWSVQTPLTEPRSNQSATLLPGGTVLIVGGFGTSGTPLASVEIQDPTQNINVSLQPLEEPRAYPTVVTLPTGTVVIVGGVGEAPPSTPGGSPTSIPLDSVVKYDPAVDATWLAITSPEPKSTTSYSNLANNTSYTVSGTCSEEGNSVNVSATDGTTTLKTTAVCSDTHTWTVNFDLSNLTDDEISLTASFQGNASSIPQATSSFTKDTTAPSAPTSLTGTSPSNDNTPNITVGGITDGNEVSIYSGSNCDVTTLLGTETASGTSVTITSSTISGDTTYYARQTDLAENVSACSTVSFVYIFDSTPAFTYTWHTGLFGTCANMCSGGGLQSRTITCKGSDGLSYPDGSCDLLTKPDSTQSCSTDPACDEGNPMFGGGSGSTEDPYLICSATQLRNIGFEDYRLTKDLDLAGGADFNGIDYLFGNFDGKNHTISNYSSSSGMVRGLFNTNYGTIHHLRLDHFNLDLIDAYANSVGALVGENYGQIHDVLVQNSHVSGYNYVGGMVGYNGGSIVHTQVTDGRVNGTYYIGGLAGYNQGNISTSSSSAAVEGDYDGGGLVGLNEGDITDSFSTGSVAAVPTEAYSGQIAGLVAENYGSILRTYASGAVTDPQGIFTGGPLGGLTTADYGFTSNSYWNTDSTGQSWSGGGNPLTSSQMNDPTNFSTWNSQLWDLVAGQHPSLKGSFAACSDTPPPPPPPPVDCVMSEFSAWGTCSDTCGGGTQTRNRTVVTQPAYGGLACPTNLSETQACNTQACCPNSFIGQTGTAANPFQVTNREDLDCVRRFPGSTFVQVAPIDLGGASAPFKPINNFYGSYNGQDYEIQNLYYRETNPSSYTGLFGYAYGTWSHINLTNVDLEGTNFVGGLVGRMAGGSATDIRVTGNIRALYDNAGGITGQTNRATISRCLVNAAVSAQGMAGGVVGLHYSYESQTSYLFDSFATGTVNARQYAGGLVGYNYNAAISNSYSTSNVFSSTSAAGGGVAGWSNNNAGIRTTTNTYSASPIVTVGTTAGSSIPFAMPWGSTDAITNVFYYNNGNQPATGPMGNTPTSGSAVGLDFNAMSNAVSFTGFDFSDTGHWRMPSVNPLSPYTPALLSPVLKWQCGRDGVQCILPTVPAEPNSLTATSPTNDATPTITVDGVTPGNTVSIFSSPTCDLTTLLGSEIASGTSVTITSSAVTANTTYYSNQSDNTYGITSACSTASFFYTYNPTPTLDMDPESISLAAINALINYPDPNRLLAKGLTVPLGNGKILFAGGYTGTGISKSVSLYDFTGNSGAGSIRKLTSLSVGRQFHSGTSLNNGKVLLTGGTSTYSDTLSLVELYDLDGNSGNGSVTTLTPLLVQRLGHSSTLLSNGKVLIAGGWDRYGGNALTSVELYDPNGNSGAGSATTLAPLAEAREGHSAFLLSSGKVLFLEGNALHAELYDPNGNSGAGSTTVLAGLTRRRFTYNGDPSHTATLLPNDKVFIAGGVGGDPSDHTNGVVEIYDPNGNSGGGSSTVLAPLSTPIRYFHTATLLSNGKILIVGGSSPWNWNPIYEVELYDPSDSGSTTNLTPLTGKRDFHSATLLADGTVAIAGGEYNSDPIERYDPSGTGAIIRATPRSTARFAHTSTLLNSGKVIVIGGTSNSGTLSSVELFDSQGSNGGSFTTLTPLLHPRYGHSSTLLSNGKILIAGGYDDSIGTLSSVELYDPAGNSGTGDVIELSPLGMARSEASATLLSSGNVVFIGGWDDAGTVPTVEMYNPSEDGSTTDLTSLITPRYNQTSTLLNNGKILVVGGTNDDSGLLTSVELYDPQGSGSTRALTPIQEGRYYHTATLLGNGKVLIAAGSADSYAPTTDIELYDAQANSGNGAVEFLTPLLHERSLHAAALTLGGKIIFAGGYDSSGFSIDHVELYDPATESSVELAPLEIGRTQHTATRLADGRIWIYGGMESHLGPLSDWSIFTEFPSTTITPSDGTGPYTFSIGSGEGIVNSIGVFTPIQTGVTVVKATDALGAYGETTITITGPVDINAITPPAPSSLTGISPTNDTTPAITVGGVTDGNEVSIYSSPTCDITSILGSETASGNTVTVTSSAIAADITYYATQTNTTYSLISPCSSASFAVILDTTAPTVDITSPTDGFEINDANADSVEVSGTCSEENTSVFVTAVSSGGGSSLSVAANCSGGTWSTTLDLSALADGDVTLTADGTDAANNTGEQDSRELTKTTTPQSAPKRYVYVANYLSGTVNQFRILEDGTLEPLDQPSLSQVWGAYSVTVSPNGEWAYVSTLGGSVYQFSIASDGTLQPLSPASISSNDDSRGVTVSPDGKWLYVANTNQQQISQFAIANDGTLSPLSPNVISAGGYADNITITPNGQFLYSPGASTSDIFQYSIDSATGLLSPLTPPSTPVTETGSSHALVSPDGQWLYVTNGANPGNTTVSQFAIESDGTLTPLDPPSVTAGEKPYGIALTPDQQYAYVTSVAEGGLSQYSVGSNGTLTPLSPARVAAGGTSAFVQVSPDGKWVYATSHTGNTVSQFAIGSDGTLTSLSPATVPAGNGTAGIYVYYDTRSAGTCTINSFTADATNVPAGGTTNLNWSTSNCSSVSIDHGIGEISPVEGGSISTGPISATTTFSLSIPNFSVLYNFAGDTQGSYPFGSLTLSSDGTHFYGMASNNGAGGKIFSVSVTGSDFTILHDFDANNMGADPTGSLTLSADGTKLYGMSRFDGINGVGTIFSINTDGSNFTVLHHFTGDRTGGPTMSFTGPSGNVTLSADGQTLYGMTPFGGSNNYGLIFSIGTDGQNFAILHSFNNSDDGAYPLGSLALSSDGTLFGMASQGGQGNSGTLFSIRLSDSLFTTIHYFIGDDGNSPNGSPIIAQDGSKLYGMTYAGGMNNWGTIFSTDLDGSNFMVHHDFANADNDGGFPNGDLVLSSDGNTLYGTTVLDGVYYSGTLFSINADGSGKTTLHTFTGGHDGANPQGNIILDSTGTLYGMTVQGGDTGFGTIFSMSNSAPQATQVTINVLPPPEAPTSVSGTSPTNNSTPNITVGGVTSGSQVSIYSSSDCDLTTLLGTETASGTSVVITSGLISSDRTYYATQLNPNGISACSTANFALIFDVTSPTVSITSPTDDFEIDNSNVSAFVVSGTCDDSYPPVYVLVTVTGGGDTSASGTATCTDGTWTTTLNLSALENGNITITADANDEATNLSEQDSHPLTKNTNAVPAYSNWTNLSTPLSGTPPPFHFNTSAVAIDGKIYIFGGSDMNSNFLNTLYSYDTATRTWTDLSTPSNGTPPSVRYAHGAAAINGKMYVFGGFGGSYLNDLHSYDPATQTWTDLSSTATGSAPSPRHSHTASEVAGKLYVFGGDNNSDTNELYVYDPATEEWTDLTSTASGNPPDPVRAHGAIGINGKLYVFGGFVARNNLHSYDPTTATWTDLSSPSNGTPPPGRYGNIGNVDGKLFVFGGTNTVNPLEDLHSYDPATASWTSYPKPSSGLWPSARAGAWPVGANSKLYLFGGGGPGVTSNELYSHSTFSPTDIPSLAFWVDASDSSTLFENSDCASSPFTNSTSSGTAVGCWKDKSGRATPSDLNVRTGEVSYNPGIFGNRPGIRFGEFGVSHLNSTVNSLSYTDHTYFIISNTNAVVSQGMAFLLNGGGYGEVFSGSGFWQWWEGSGFGTNIPTTGKQKITVVKSGSNGTFTVDGTSASFTGMGTALVVGEAYVGGWNNEYGMNGDIGEVIVYDSALSAQQIARVQEYLNDKYDFTASYSAPTPTPEPTQYCWATAGGRLIYGSVCTNFAESTICTNWNLNINRFTTNEYVVKDSNGTVVQSGTCTAVAPSVPASVSGTSPTNDTTPDITVGGVINGNTVSIYSSSNCDISTLLGTETASGFSVTITSNTISGDTTYYATQSNNGGISACSTASFALTLDNTPQPAAYPSRNIHTSTLLPNGKVLIVAGRDSSNVNLTSVELFDPNANGGAGSVAELTPLNTPRIVHTATLLTDGTVLIMGGYNNGILSSVERYDPAGNGSQGSTTPMNPMIKTRYQHAAVRVLDNKVLIIGGYDGGDFTSVELYDPDANSGTGSSALITPQITGRRVGESMATVLSDGKVLLAGGINTSSAILETVEIYDPAGTTGGTPGSSTALTNLAIPRAAHTKTLLSDGKILFVGGYISGVARWDVELYDPSGGGSTTSLTGLSSGLYAHAASLLADGTVLITGGNNQAGAAQRSKIIYDPSGSGSANVLSDLLPSALTRHTSTTLSDGRVLIFGGADTANWSIHETASIPSTIPSLAFWIDANDTSTLFGSADCSTDPLSNSSTAGTSVACWKDKSGNGHHLTSGTGEATYDPGVFGTKNAIRFGETSVTYMKSSAGLLTLNDFTYFMVVNSRSDFAPGSGLEISSTFLVDGGGYNQLYGESGTWHLYQNGYVNSNVPTQGKQLITVVSSNGNGYIGVNGVESQSFSGLSAGASGRVYVGGWPYPYGMDGDIAEIIVYNTGLSADEIAQVQTYLTSKYGGLIAGAVTPPTSLSGISPTNDSTPNITVAGVTSGNEVSVYSDSNCSLTSLLGTEIASGTSVTITSGTISSDITYYAKQTQLSSGLQSACSTANFALIYDNTDPTVDLTSPADNFVIDNSNVAALIVSGTCSDDQLPVTVTVTATSDNGGSTTGTAVCSDGTWTTTLDLSGLSNGDVTIIADASDAATNTAPQDSHPLTKNTCRVPQAIPNLRTFNPSTYTVVADFVDLPIAETEQRHFTFYQTTGVSVMTPNSECQSYVSFDSASHFLTVNSLPPGLQNGDTYPCRLEFSDENSNFASVDVMLTPNTSAPETKTLKFRLVDINGNVITPQNSGATFHVVNSVGGESQTTVDANFRYTAEVYTGSTYFYSVNTGSMTSAIELPENFSRIHGTIDVQSDMTTDLVVPAKAVTVHITDENGVAVPNASVNWWGGSTHQFDAPWTWLSISDSSGGGHDVNWNSTALSDCDGNATVYAGILTEFHTQVNPLDGSARTIYNDFNITDTSTVNVIIPTLPPAYDLRFRLVDRNGTIITQTNSDLRPQIVTSIGSAPAATIDSNGVYSVRVYQGSTYIYDNNTISTLNPLLELPNSFGFGGTIDVQGNLTIDLTLPVQAVTVNVKDTNGDPVVNANINWYSGGPYNFDAEWTSFQYNNASGSYDINGNSPAATDANGNVTLYIPAAAEAHIVVNPQDGSGRSIQNLRDLQTTNTANIVIATLPPVRTMNFRLVDVNGSVITPENSGITPQIVHSLGGTATINANSDHSYTSSVYEGSTYVYFNGYSSIQDHALVLPESFGFGGTLDVSGDLTTDLIIPAQVVTIHVVDSLGTSVANASVNWWAGSDSLSNPPWNFINMYNASGSSDVYGNSAYTDSNGSVVMYMTLGQSVHISVHPDDGSGRTIGADFDLRTSSSATIEIPPLPN